MKKLLCVVFALLFVVLPLCSCGSRQTTYTDEMFALDTIIRFTLYDEDEDLCKDTVDKCKKEITRLENLLSATKKDSDIGIINNRESSTVSVSDETVKLIEKANKLSLSCDGAFDITVKPLVTLWGFDSKNYSVPNSKDIKDTLVNIGYEKIKTDGTNVTLDDGMALDLGGIAKGYVCERVTDIIKNSKIDSALVNLGGMIATVGKSSSEDKKHWHIGVEYPSDSEDYFFTFDVTQPYVSTTGAYQRYFEQDSEIYHHILDTKTGCPAKSDISSVSVISDSGVECDALSTAFYVLGIEKTIDYINKNLTQNGERYQVVVLSDDMKTLYLSREFEEENIAHRVEKSFDDIKIVYI